MKLLLQLVAVLALGFVVVGALTFTLVSVGIPWGIDPMLGLTVLAFGGLIVGWVLIARIGRSTAE